MSMFKLIPGIQSYDWGKLGENSKAAKFAQVSIPNFVIENDKPYAELWMGTHETCPSYLSDQSSKLLSQHLNQNPHLVGEDVRRAFEDTTKDGGLPFLFKVLAIEKALSVQAHPDKCLAQQLNKSHPDIYKDSNHKPEMAIALTEFKGFCGFKPKIEIIKFLNNVIEFKEFVDDQDIRQLDKATDDQNVKQALKKIFNSVMSVSQEKINEQVNKLIGRYSNDDAFKSSDIEDENLRSLVLTLNKQFPNDIGIFCSYLLNVVELKPGQSVFLKANDPHAYISGDIIECMATSNNVVRAGLTPKLRDVKTLVNMLTYENAPADTQLMETKSLDGAKNTDVYDPPIEEFSVARVKLNENEITEHRPINGPSIIIVTKGEGIITNGDDDAVKPSGQSESLSMSEGEVIFIGSKTSIKIKGSKGNLELYRAFAEV